MTGGYCLTVAVDGLDLSLLFSTTAIFWSLCMGSTSQSLQEIGRAARNKKVLQYNFPNMSLLSANIKPNSAIVI